jgi:hypothetical protein
MKMGQTWTDENLKLVHRRGGWETAGIPFLA